MATAGARPRWPPGKRGRR